MFLLRLFPWWLFLVFALLAGSLTYNFAQSYLQDQRSLEEALANPPEVIDVQNLPDAELSPSFREFAVRGFGAASTGVFEAGRNGRSFLVVESYSEFPIFVAFTGGTFNEDRFDEESERIQADWENYVVRGMLTDSTLYQADLIEFLRGEGVPIDGGTMLMAELLIGDRDTALRNHVSSGRTIAIVAAVITAIFALIALAKFRAWRKRPQAV